MRASHCFATSVILLLGAGCEPEPFTGGDRWGLCDSVETLPPEGAACEGDGWGCTGVEASAERWSAVCVRGRMGVVTHDLPFAGVPCTASGMTVETTSDPCSVRLSGCSPTGDMSGTLVALGCSGAGGPLESGQATMDCDAALTRLRPGDACEGSWGCSAVLGGMLRVAWCGADTVHFGEVPFG